MIPHVDGLAEERLGRSSRSGAMFLYFGKRRTALKVLFFDGSGLCVFHKRLDRGVFRIPEAMNDAGVVQIEEHVLDALLDGIEVDKPRASKARRRTPRAH